PRRRQARPRRSSPRRAGRAPRGRSRDRRAEPAEEATGKAGVDPRRRPPRILAQARDMGPAATPVDRLDDPPVRGEAELERVRKAVPLPEQAVEAGPDVDAVRVRLRPVERTHEGADARDARVLVARVAPGLPAADG